MRRFLAFVVLFACSVPVGLSISGCGHNPNNYCIKNGHAYGVLTTQVVYVTLQPETTGLSLAWGQTASLGTPQAYNCNHETESVSKWIYGSSNLLLADISPTAQVCAGTWNRNSPGGVPDFTICTPPSGSSLSSFSGCTASTCGTAQISAQGGGATSNPVNVYVHPPITAITIPTQTACYSQGQTLTTSFLAETTVSGPGGAILCCPTGSTLQNGTACPATVPSCSSPSANVGTITYSPITGSVVTINNTTNPTSTTTTTTSTNPNGIATANLPGSTVINASNSEVTSAAGFFSTCPPQTIALTLNGSTSGTVTASSPQTVVSHVTDTKGATITGLPLSYSSTEPQNLTVSSTGLVTATFPSHATVNAVCQPPSCNPAPVNLIGTLGNGMPVAGNNVSINSPGRVTNRIWMASSQSPYFSEVDLLTGGAASPIRMPYTPNSMVMDQAGDSLFFGSYHELMIYATSSNTLSKEVPSVPGAVIAVSPTGSTVVVNDQLRDVIYIYTASSGAVSSIGGLANHAQYSPDGGTVYVSGYDPAKSSYALFVYSANTGWSEYPLNNQASTTWACQLEAAPTNGDPTVPAYNPSFDPFCGPTPTITIPQVAAFISGSAATTTHSYCPSATATPPYFPPAGDVGVATEQLTATADGDHVLGASGSTFSDTWLYQDAGKTTPGVPINACPAYNGPAALTLNTTPTTGNLTFTPAEIDQVVSSPDSSVAFVTYNYNGFAASLANPSVGTGGTGLLPYYQPSASAGAFGTLGTPIQLSTVTNYASPQSPLAGIFSPDGSIFFVSTSGDNLVHMVDPTALTDTGTINPKLVNSSGSPVPPIFLAVQSRSTT
ncbi:MAG TPA: hypothetical protein VHU89_07480 [Acidobacteriaceae bacterium]|jgi:hypothetical protein|nr:hypothetical protein [Acidobacteriaceae bacterium]